MPSFATPFSLPDTFERSLERFLSYWEGLKRAGNEMPFWDDLKPPALSDQSEKLVLIDVFVQPERFRFNFLATELTQRYGETLVRQFADEISLREPFAYLRAQCSATVESGRPTYFRCDASDTSPGSASYSRILLPLWGEGQIRMLLSAVDWR